MGRQGDQHGSDGKQRPLLVGDRQPEQDARPASVPPLGGQHGGDAQYGPEQLLRMSPLQGLQRHRVHDAQAQDGRAGEPVVAERAHLRQQPDREQRRNDQTWDRNGLIDRDLATTEQAGQECERRAHLE
jgi:hypothetical protein